MLDSYAPDQLNAFWAGVTAMTAVVTGLVAILTLRSLTRDSRDRSRPVISVEVLPHVLVKGTVELVVQNVGLSVAKDLTVTFDPAITQDIGPTAAFIAKRYSHTIPTMGPGRRLTNLYANWVGDGTSATTEPVPKEVLATARYKDGRGRTYMDRYALTLETLRNHTRTAPSDTDDFGLRKRAVQALEVIAEGVHHG